MNVKVCLATAVTLSAATLALAQYTPGTGAIPAPVYSPPAAPVYAPPPTSVQIAPAAQPDNSQPIQIIQPAPLQAVAPGTVQIIQPPPAIPQLSDQQLADLTSSVALYPDPLLAEMLPAATYVQEITYADRWLAQHPGADEATLASLPLHPSVTALLHYPTLLSMMSDHIDWTQALGVAFQYQPNDVMESVQRWRATAVAYGTLASSPQMQVLQQGATIMIVPPPQATLIYVPVYDPGVVFVRPRRPIRDAITFGAGGFSISFVQNDVDWHTHVIHVPEHVVEHHPGEHVEVLPEKKVFVHDDAKPIVLYPTKIETPTGDHKVVVVPDTHGRGRDDASHDMPPGTVPPPVRGGGPRGTPPPPGTPF